MEYQSGSLLTAVESGKVELVKQLLATPGCVVDELNEKKETPLMVACHNYNVELAALLMDAGADINKQDAIQDSPYLFVGAHGKTEILKLMLKRTDINYKVFNRYGGNCIIPASEKGHLENVRVLLADGREDVNHMNRLGWTALIEVVYYDNDSELYQQIARALLEAGADPNIPDANHKKTALTWAIEKGFTNLEALIRSFGGKE
ncbi:hypothetical protein SAMD00019534_118920 [Acytostelium subglobosum LB1]|uniref:hypothetical protein n=1 Tax=Acytostelium subglobosum LB1 TaxID=1410327 RepID=UPI00064518C8|nr:hypothetical protein SAMD00019534_118920 [Acytostelium subglobosum LB1]GAM28716.1 hypothetical protein SAMD00019534_118920 [Acytostelium subglobosum LB1]|eukprot:XP_012748271.1 hypothetical protein SAMD00019534_118920 [Acytostelium subglobosum LB1]